MNIPRGTSLYELLTETTLIPSTLHDEVHEASNGHSEWLESLMIARPKQRELKTTFSHIGGLHHGQSETVLSIPRYLGTYLLRISES